MNIAEVNVKKLDEGTLKGIVSVNFDGVFVVKDIRIIEGKNGLFVAMPSRKKKDGEFVDIAHPISAEFREELVGKILEKYQEQE